VARWPPCTTKTCPSATTATTSTPSSVRPPCCNYRVGDTRYTTYFYPSHILFVRGCFACVCRQRACQSAPENRSAAAARIGGPSRGGAAEGAPPRAIAPSGRRAAVRLAQPAGRDVVPGRGRKQPRVIAFPLHAHLAVVAAEQQPHPRQQQQRRRRPRQPQPQPQPQRVLPRGSVPVPHEAPGVVDATLPVVGKIAHDGAFFQAHVVHRSHRPRPRPRPQPQPARSAAGMEQGRDVGPVAGQFQHGHGQVRVAFGGGGSRNHTQGTTAPAPAAGLLIHTHPSSPFLTSPRLPPPIVVVSSPKSSAHHILMRTPTFDAVRPNAVPTPGPGSGPGPGGEGDVAWSAAEAGEHAAGAVGAIEGLTRLDLSDMRRLVNPPVAVAVVMEAVMILVAGRAMPYANIVSAIQVGLWCGGVWWGVVGNHGTMYTTMHLLSSIALVQLPALPCRRRATPSRSTSCISTSRTSPTPA
jgi:hypothetical protein